MDVDINTIHYWKRTKPEFLAALQNGKNIADARVEQAFFEVSVGYSHPDVHISNYQGEITVTPITKHYPPNAWAAFKWLSIRQRERWADTNKTPLIGNINMLNIDLSDFGEDELAMMEKIGMGMTKQITPHTEV